MNDSYSICTDCDYDQDKEEKDVSRDYEEIDSRENGTSRKALQTGLIIVGDNNRLDRNNYQCEELNKVSSSWRELATLC